MQIQVQIQIQIQIQAEAHLNGKWRMFVVGHCLNSNSTLPPLHFSCAPKRFACLYVDFSPRSLPKDAFILNMKLLTQSETYKFKVHILTYKIIEAEMKPKELFSKMPFQCWMLEGGGAPIVDIRQTQPLPNYSAVPFTHFPLKYEMHLC